MCIRDRTWYDTNVKHHYHIFIEGESRLVDVSPDAIDISIPKKLTKGKISKVDLVVKVNS